MASKDRPIVIEDDDDAVSVSKPSGLTLLIPDREQLEQERLRRAEKRARPESEASALPVKAARTGTVASGHRAAPRHTPLPRYRPVQAGDRFWRGTFKVQCSTEA